CSSQKLSQRCH
ncbi:Ribose-phosphate pyrophosphokinase, partial [Haemophilus influenzae]